MAVAKTDIRVSIIEPGLVETELQDHFPVHPWVTFNIEQPLKPADIARCVRCIHAQPPPVRITILMVMPGDQPM